MKLGLLAYSSKTGLGYQTYEFYRHLKPAKTLVVDLSPLNGCEQNPDWYPDGMHVTGIPNNQDIETFVKGLDCILVAETPLNYYLFDCAKKAGVKIIHIPNYEFLDYAERPYLPVADLIIAPSMWHYQELENFANEHNTKITYIHHPVNREEFQYRKIDEFKTFIHILGRPTANDRNGTMAFLYAARLLTGDYKYKVFYQTPLDHRAKEYFEPVRQRLEQFSNLGLIELIADEQDNTKIYNSGDVLVLPRRYGGNCLPLNEAISCGMPVIMPDISPNNEFLPKNWLVGASEAGVFRPRTEFMMYDVNPDLLLDKIKEFKTMTPNYAYLENLKADKLAQTISWKALTPKYLKEIEELCHQ